MDRFGFVVGRCGSLWVVVGRFGSLWMVPRFSNYGYLSIKGFDMIRALG